MGEKYTVRLEPVGIEMEVDEDETILNAAFRQGLMLMHGCKEGQCSACKSFLLDGEVDLDRYSTFALPDFEEAEGWTLLCRAHALSDLEIELINFDEEVLRSGVAMQTARTRVEAVEELTHDIRRLRAEPREPERLDVPCRASTWTSRCPGADEHRSFSMANTPASRRSSSEFMIKLYHDGHFSGLLENGRGRGRRRAGGDRALRGVHAAVQLAAAAALHRRRRRAWRRSCRCCARWPSRAASARRSTTTARGAPRTSSPRRARGARRGAARLPLRPGAVRGRAQANGWDGETGLITDVVDRLEEDLTEVDAYLCGPPPMVDAAIALLERKGVPESRIYFDKFTTTADD